MNSSVTPFLSRAQSFPVQVLSNEDPSQLWEDLVPHIEHHHWCALNDFIVGGPFKVNAADIWQTLRDEGLLSLLKDFFEHLKKQLTLMSSHLHVGLDKLVTALKSKQIFAFLKAVGFNLLMLVKPLKIFADLYRDGIMKVFEELHKTKALQMLNSGAMKLDDLLNKYPILKRLAGPAVAGLLVWMFLAGNCTGNPSTDIDFTAAIQAALHGNWSTAELFTSPSGLLALTLLVTSLTGLFAFTPIWLTSAIPINILTALVYTGYKHLNTPDAKKILKEIAQHTPLVKV